MLWYSGCVCSCKGVDKSAWFSVENSPLRNWKMYENMKKLIMKWRNHKPACKDVRWYEMNWRVVGFYVERSLE